ncbi:MAG TPA: hypothetical protein VK851_13320 [Anaerolineales bacterium]|nr:hypothetical protein [Anaerolineales bacterium]
MANHSNSKQSIPTIAAIVGIMGAFVTILAFGFVFSPSIQSPTPTAIQPTSSPPPPIGSYQPEVIPPATYTPGPTRTPTSTPTNTPVPTQTLIPTLVSSRQLPDLTVTAITRPFCRPDYEGTILEFTFFVRNIGSASTRTFGHFDVGVFVVLGQRHYSLEEWDTQFNGVLGATNLEIFNLNPDDDIKFTVVIDLKGNKEFGVEVIVNAGENPIPEADGTNNRLIKYYSMSCYD